MLHIAKAAQPDQPVAGWARDVRKIKAEIVVIDTAPTEREMGASAALADIILVPCTASGLDAEATERTLGIIEAVRKRRHEPMKVVLVPNQIDRRTLEGRQLVEELEQFGEEVAPALTNRSAYVRCFAAGESVATFASEEPADLEVRALGGIVEENLRHPRFQEGTSSRLL